MRLWGRSTALVALPGMAIALALAGLAGCGGRSHIDRESLPAPGLPELSALAELPARAVSAVTYCQYGEEFYRFYTRQVQAVGSRAVFSPDAPDGGIGADGMAYTLYRFDIDSGAALNELRVAWEQAPPGGAVWIGLSDWQRGCWEWHEAGDVAETVISGLDGQKYLDSVGLQTWVAVVACGRTPVGLENLRWTGVGSEPVVTGYVKDDTGNGLAGVTVHCGGDLSQVTGPDGYYQFLGIHGDVSLVPYHALDEFAPPEQALSVGQDDVRAADFVRQPGGAAWPMYGHDARQSRLSEVNGPQHGTLKWTYRTLGAGSPYWYPVMAPDGTVVIGAQNSCYSYSADGTRNWRFDGAFRFMGVPAIAPDGTVYFINDMEDKLYALDSQGGVKWTFDLLVNNIYWGYNLAADQYGAVIIDQSKLSRISAEGQLLWTQPVEDSQAEHAFHRRSIALGPDGTAYYTGCEACYARNLDGTLKYEATSPEIWFDHNASIAVAVDGTIYVDGGGSSGRYSSALAAISPAGIVQWVCDIDPFNGYTDWFNGREVYLAPDGNIITASVAALQAVSPAGSIVWTAPGSFNPNFFTLQQRSDGKYNALLQSDSSSDSSAITAFDPDGQAAWSVPADGGFILLAGNPQSTAAVYVTDKEHNSRITCIDEDGLLLWESSDGAPVASPVVSAQNEVYINAGSTCYAIDPSGQLRWSQEVGSRTNGAPAVSGESIYLTNMGGKLTELNAAGGISSEAQLSDLPISAFSPLVDRNGVVYLSYARNYSGAYDDPMVARRQPNGWITKHAVGDRSISLQIAVNTDGDLLHSYYIGQQMDPAELHLVSLAGGTIKWDNVVGTYSVRSDFFSIGLDNSVAAIVRTAETPAGMSTGIGLNPDGSTGWSLDLPGGGIVAAMPDTRWVLFGGSDTDNLIFIAADGSGYESAPRPQGAPGGGLAVGADGTLYFAISPVGGKDTAYACSPDGTVKWSYESPSGSDFTGFAIGPDGTLYAACDDCCLYAFAD